VTRVAWVCGPEPVLRHDVTAAYAEALPGASRWNLWPESNPWDILLAVPSGPRLVTVWGAEKLGHLDRLPLLLADEFDRAFTVFVSADDDFPRTEERSEKPDRPRSVLAPSLAALRDSRHGQLVRCTVPKDPEGQAQLAASWWPGAGRNFGAALLERCAGDIAAARHAALKAGFADLPPEVPALDLVCPPAARYEFADLMVAGNVKAAMAAAAFTPPDQAGQVLALLSSRLTVLSVLSDAARKGVSAQDAAIRLKIDAYSVRLLRPYAAAYTPRRTARCREVLALAESAWKSGARDGILEAVAALWA
jgi:hypothetical protein